MHHKLFVMADTLSIVCLVLVESMAWTRSSSVPTKLLLKWFWPDLPRDQCQSENIAVIHLCSSCANQAFSAANFVGRGKIRRDWRNFLQSWLSRTFHSKQNLVRDPTTYYDESSCRVIRNEPEDPTWCAPSQFELRTATSAQHCIDIFIHATAI